MTQAELERLAIVETKIDQVLRNQNDMWPSITAACQSSALHEQRLGKVEESVAAKASNERVDSIDSKVKALIYACSALALAIGYSFLSHVLGK